MKVYRSRTLMIIFGPDPPVNAKNWLAVKAFEIVAVVASDKHGDFIMHGSGLVFYSTDNDYFYRHFDEICP